MQNIYVAKAVLYDENTDVLILRRSKTDPRRPLEWDLPGGSVDYGEDFTSAVVREIQEETKIFLRHKSMKLVYAATEIRDNKNITRLFYVARISNILPKLSFEHDIFHWLSLDKAIRAIDYPSQHNFLRHLKKNNLLVDGTS